eukprot:11191411-Alexandrium_andersonii.AAC.1
MALASWGPAQCAPSKKHATFARALLAEPGFSDLQGAVKVKAHVDWASGNLEPTLKRHAFCNDLADQAAKRGAMLWDAS